DPRWSRRLRHEEPDQLLLGVHPEEGAGRASPHELSGAPRSRRQAVLLTDGEPEPEGEALDAEEQLAGRDAIVLDLAELIGGHQRHGGPAQQARSVEL